MSKLFGLLLVLALTSTAYGVTWEFFNNGHYSFQLQPFSGIPGSGDLYFTANLEENLGWPQTAALVCFWTDGFDGEVEDNDYAFALRFWCNLGECKYNYHLGADFSAVEGIVDNGDIIFDGPNALDKNLDFKNTGVLNADDGRHPDTNYSVKSGDSVSNHRVMTESVPITWIGGTSYLSGMLCFANDDVNFWDSNLLTQIEVSDWEKQYAIITY